MPSSSVTALWLLPACGRRETIDIAIGHQSMCTGTYRRHRDQRLKLLRSTCRATASTPAQRHNITWADYASGGSITNQMLAGKLSFGVMGDYPLSSTARSFRNQSLRTIYVSGTGCNLKGAGNAIVVRSARTSTSEDLKGKAISTPVGSASWAC